MTTSKIHPIVLGTKIFDKGMMTYQHDYGTPYTIPIYTWYLEGEDKNILIDTGEMHPVQSADGEAAIGGKIRALEIEVIPPGTHINTYEAYDMMIKLREMADIILPLHEPRFAGLDTIG